MSCLIRRGSVGAGFRWMSVICGTDALSAATPPSSAQVVALVADLTPSPRTSHGSAGWEAQRGSEVCAVGRVAEVRGHTERVFGEREERVVVQLHVRSRAGLDAGGDREERHRAGSFA